MVLVWLASEWRPLSDHVQSYVLGGELCSLGGCGHYWLARMEGDCSSSCCSSSVCTGIVCGKRLTVGWKGRSVSEIHAVCTVQYPVWALV